MRRRSLFSKFMIVVIITVIIPFTASNFFTYNSNYNYVLKQLIELNNEYMTKGIQTVEDFYRRLDEIPAEILGNTAAINILLKDDLYSSSERYYMMNIFLRLCENNPELEGIHYSSSINGESFEARQNVVTDSVSTQEALKSNLIGNYDNIVIFGDEDDKPTYLEYTTRLVNIPYTDELGEVTLFLNVKKMDELYVNLVNTQEKATIMIFIGDENHMVYSSQAVKSYNVAFEQLSINQTYQGQLNGESGIYIIKEGVYKKRNIYLVKFIEMESIQGPAKEALLQGLLLQMLALFIICGFLLFSSYILLKPIRRMMSNMEKVEAGDFQYNVTNKGNDELAVLERRYGQMVENIDVLVNKNYRYELENTKARLKMLQAQINPHFLYNMLQYISTTALKSGNYEVNEQIAQLGSLFKYNMDMRRDVVPLRDELVHIENYIELQKGRFINKIRFSSDVDDKALDIMIPKMILQPLIENSIEHGIKGDTGVGLIHLGIHLGKELIIQIVDNGRGFHPDTIKEIEDAYKGWEVEDRNIGIGIVNVLHRLKIHCNNQFRWKITSRPNEETQIELIIGIGETNENFNRG